MNNHDIKSHIKKSIPLKKIHLTGNKDHIHIIAIGEIFSNLKEIQRQQLVYEPLTKYIIKKQIHAVTIDTFTPKEWEKKNKYM